MGGEAGGNGDSTRLIRRAGIALGVCGGVLVVGALVGTLLLQTQSDDAAPKPGQATPTTTTTTTARALSATPMRVSATPRDFLMGTAVTVEPLRDDEQYARTVASEYNAITPENAMKWDFIHPEQGRYDFGPADSIMRFARDHDMTVRGHTLVWYRQVPSWVNDRPWTRPELEQVLRDHILTVVGRYRGQVAQWDVVNEALDSEGKPRDSVWMRVIGPDYIDLAFRWAYEADPDAALYYNDFDLEGPGRKADAVTELVRGLKARGVPIDGVGIQAHEMTAQPPSRTQLEAQIRRYAGLGLDVGITELDVGILLPTDAAKLEQQARVYGDMLDACLAVRRCRTFVTWGFTDQHSWIPGELPGVGDALPFDATYRPKPAAAALRGSLAQIGT